MTGIVRGAALSEGFAWRKITGALVYISDPVSDPSLSPANEACVFVQNGGDLLLYDVTELENRLLVDAAYKALADSDLPAHSENCYMSAIFDESIPDAAAVVADGGGVRGLATAAVSAVEKAGKCDNPDPLSYAEDRFVFAADAVVKRVLRDSLLLGEIYHDVVYETSPRVSRVISRDLPDDELAVGRFAGVLAGLDTPGNFRTIAAYTSGKGVTDKAFAPDQFMRDFVGEVFLNRTAELLFEDFGSEGKESLLVLVAPVGSKSYSVVSFDDPGDADTDLLVYRATAVSLWRELSLRTKESYAHAVQFRSLRG